MQKTLLDFFEVDLKEDEIDQTVSKK